MTFVPVFQRTLIPVFKISLLPKPGSSGKPLGQLLQMCNSYHEAFFFFLNWTFSRHFKGMSWGLPETADLCFQTRSTWFRKHQRANATSFVQSICSIWSCAVALLLIEQMVLCCPAVVPEDQGSMWKVWCTTVCLSETCKSLFFSCGLRFVEVCTNWGH